MHPVFSLGLPLLVAIALGPSFSPTHLFVALVVLLPVARLHRVFLGPVFVLFGLLIANSLPKGPVLRGPVAIQGWVVAAPMGRQADVEVWGCAEGGSPFLECAGRVRVVFDAPPSPGSQWVIRGRASAPRREGLGGPQVADALARSKIRTVLWARKASPLNGELAPTAPHVAELGLLAAIATGDRRGVDPDAWQILRDTGTAHLLAISGFHVGVVAGTLGGLTFLLIRRAGVLWPAGVHPAIAWWVGAGGALLYAWSAGAPISAQRAAGMVVLGAIARSFSRTVDPWRILLLVAVGVLSIDPAALVSPGFQLSFGAVVGLLRFGGPLHRGLWLPWGLGWMRSGLAASTAATLGTLPAAAWWFQSFAPSSPLANLIAIPWMAVGIAPFAAVWAYGPEPLAGWAGALGSWSVWSWLWVLEGLVVTPWTPAVDGLGAFFLSLIFLRAHPRWVLTILLIGLGLRARPRGGLEVLFFDVGQGDAALVQFEDGERWLVDGGRSARIVPALRRLGVRRLDRVIASHGDADHAGGLAAVLCGLHVEELVVGRVKDHEALINTAEGCGVRVRIEGHDEGLEANAVSLVVTAKSSYGDVLFTGDLDEVGELALQSKARVLKVPHHGSKSSSSSHLLDSTQPELAIVSVGFNRYGHPHPNVLNRYAMRGIELLRTDERGGIRVRLDAKGVRYGAMGPFTWFSGDLRATKKKTMTAKRARARLMPWL